MHTLIWIMLVLLLNSCGPVAPHLEMRDACLATASATELVQNHWLNAEHIWRLRQSALLEIGTRKIALEGFLRLDLKMREARLIALNEIGLVVFDLHVDMHTQELIRAVPQVRETKGFAQGVGSSLRSMFLAPVPQVEDELEQCGHYQYLLRVMADTTLEFVFDCDAHLRRTHMQGAGATWQVVYNNYRNVDGATAKVALPAQIILYNAQQRMKLTLTLNEAREEL
ncbi:MAG: DUF3261 domain-containing protein [Desulfuromonadaceae bacterium]|nr:DUF3261 domain-containing protein [Desulfuromonadaceae bacterium]